MLSRILATLLAAVGGGLAGSLMGGGNTALVAAIFGAALAAAGVAAFDAWRGHRLLDWLRGAHDSSAPRNTGLWGEAGYRVERAVRALEHTALLERGRLEQLIAAIDASPNGVLLLDANDQIEWCNSKAADHFGLDPQRDRRQRVTNLVRSPDFVAYMQAGDFDESVLLREPGGRGSLSVIVRRFDVDMKLVLSQDMTGQERSDAMRRDFVANVSHEIRTPLTVLAGFIETMKNLPLTDTERSQVLALMTQQADRMGSLVSDLLTLAQLEGSPRPASDQWISLDGMLATVEVDAIVLSAGRHMLGFPAPTCAQIAGSERELLSAFTNLVNNAIRYTPEGGRIQVGWSIGANGSGVLSVTDSGIGIAREHLSRLTERFYRVDGSRSRDSGGTGLGLAIVKHVAQRHGGELAIASELGNGSTFRIVFPAVRVRTAAGQEAEATLERVGTAAR